jgi:hypothetical protein
MVDFVFGESGGVALLVVAQRGGVPVAGIVDDLSHVIEPTRSAARAGPQNSSAANATGRRQWKGQSEL